MLLINKLSSAGFGYIVTSFWLKSTFDKAPFYTQELAVKIAYGSVANSYLFEELNKKYKHNETHLTDSITYPLGGGGTGKTTVLFKLIVELLKEEETNNVE